VWAGAEAQFEPPPKELVATRRAAFRAAARKLTEDLEAQGSQYAAAWWRHLRWHLIEPQVAAGEDPALSDLRVVRRWLYSNQEGLEHAMFAELRQEVDPYLDALAIAADPDLESTFRDQLAVVRSQTRALDTEPSDANALALGRTLGWFERTGQVPDRVDAVRSQLEFPNAQIVVRLDLIRNVVLDQTTEITRSLPVYDRVRPPRTGLGLGPDEFRVVGTATSEGTVALRTVPNRQRAELEVVFEGHVHSRCRARAEGLTVHVQTNGPVTAVKPMYLQSRDLIPGETTVDARVSSGVTGVTADSRLVQRIGERRAQSPENRAEVWRVSWERTRRQIREEMDTLVGEVTERLLAEARALAETLGGFDRISAPFIREGSTPQLTGSHSTQEGLVWDVKGRSRGQFAAPIPCPPDLGSGDVTVRMHLSLFANTAETSLAGKWLTDDFFMKYAKVIHPQLPLALMVHSRADTWAVLATSSRPLDVQTDGPNQWLLRMQFDALKIGGEVYPQPATWEVRYRFAQDEYGDARFTRVGQPVLTTELAPDLREFLHHKLDAFFGEEFSGGGVALPDGGVLGALRNVQLLELEAEGQWLAVSFRIPPVVIQDVRCALHGNCEQ
jgi:hypothetical protein